MQLLLQTDSLESGSSVRKTSFDHIISFSASHYLTSMKESMSVFMLFALSQVQQMPQQDLLRQGLPDGGLGAGAHEDLQG